MRQKIHTCLLNSGKVAIVSSITAGIPTGMLRVILGEVHIDRSKLRRLCHVAKKSRILNSESRPDVCGCPMLLI